jgi:hypothetical protein
MLDYDYTERMNLKDISIWINRQLQSSKISIIDHNNDYMHQPIMMAASKIENNSEIKKSNVQNTFCKDKSRVKQIKNNSVYMGNNR